MLILNKYCSVVGERINNHQVILWEYDTDGKGWELTITTTSFKYCPNCGAKMDEVSEDVSN